MEFYFCVQALMREGGRKKYLASSGGLEKIFKEKTKIPIAPPTNEELVFVAKVFHF